MRIAFHTPLNAHGDGRISGDRRMARQLGEALAGLGHEVMPIEGARSYLRSPDLEHLTSLHGTMEIRARALLAEWRDGNNAPDLWFTYHSYYKAPDLLGPALSDALAVPYIIAEASDSARRAVGEWAGHVALARAGFERADLHLCFTGRDRAGLAALLGPTACLVELPPFIEATSEVRRHGPGVGPCRLICVAMMRPGDKHESYLALVRTLSMILDRDWTLTLIGDGPMRTDVEAAFAALPRERLVWRGALEPPAVAAALAAHDLFVWPGLGEAYGLVYLEAQAAGLPVVAFASGGVPDAVQSGVTGLLAPARDEAALADALRRLLKEPALRRKMGDAARDFILRERSPGKARDILQRSLHLARQRLAFRQALARARA